MSTTTTLVTLAACVSASAFNPNKLFHLKTKTIMEKQINTRVLSKIDTQSNWDTATEFIPRKGEIIIYSVDSNYSYSIHHKQLEYIHPIIHK